MGRPRIVIADEDYKYTVALQRKFAQEYFERIDIEIITDEEYFRKLFSIPQKLDILIISEGLYSRDIHRHNIGAVFVMTETQEEGKTEELNSYNLFKYTSINAIFDTIIGKHPLQVSKIDEKKPQIVLVYSAAGGVGKTTVALGICGSLAKNYKKVLYINAARLQTFQQHLKNRSAISTSEIYAKLTKADESLYDSIKHVIRVENFSYLPPFKGAVMSLGLRYSTFERLAVSARSSGDFDYIVVDADSAFDEDKADLLNAADRVLIITDQSASSVYATSLLVNSINGINSEKYIFVCNDFSSDRSNALVSRESEKNFTVNDYIPHFSDYDGMKCEDFAKEKGLQNVAVLIM